MKKRKKLTLVFKDTVDIRNLYYLRNHIEFLIKDTDCTCYHFFNSNYEQFEQILSSYLRPFTNSIQVKKVHKKLNVLHYLKNYIKRFNYFFSNSLISTSSLQKCLEYAFLPRKFFVYKIKVKNKLLKLDSNLESSSLKNLLDINKSLIIFFRSDSIHNSLIQIEQNDVVINLLRNLDTTFLKGPPIVNGDYVLNTFYPIINKTYLKAFKGHKCIDIKSNTKVMNKINKNLNSKSNKINVLYAMSQQYTTNNELNIIVKLKEIVSPNINLKVKLHGSNPEYYYNYLYDLNLIDHDLAYLENPNKTFEDLNYRFLNLNKYQVCIGLGTTFFLDAFRSGIQYNLYITDEKYFPYKALYNREHLQLLFNYIKAIKIENLNDIARLINTLV